jgi:hypothetical protein
MAKKSDRSSREQQFLRENQATPKALVDGRKHTMAHIDKFITGHFPAVDKYLERTKPPGPILQSKPLRDALKAEKANKK